MLNKSWYAGPFGGAIDDYYEFPYIAASEPLFFLQNDETESYDYETLTVTLSHVVGGDGSPSSLDFPQFPDIIDNSDGSSPDDVYFIVDPPEDENGDGWYGTVVYEYTWCTKAYVPLRITGIISIKFEPPEIRLFETETLFLNVDGTPIVNFGDSPLGNPVFKQFVVMNVGLAPLVLESITSLPPGFSLEEELSIASLNQWETTTFTLRLDASISAQFSGGFSLKSTDRDQSPFYVSVRGATYGINLAEIDVLFYERSLVSGSSFIDFGNPGHGDTPTRTMTIVNRGSGPLLISAINVPSDFSLASPSSGSMPTLGDTFLVIVQFRDPSNTVAKGLTATLSIESNDGNGDESTFSVNLNWSSNYPNFYMEDPRENEILNGDTIYHGSGIQGKDSVIRSYTLTNSGSGPLEITSIDMSGDGWTLLPYTSSVEPNGGTLDLEFRLDADTAATGDHMLSVTITHTDLAISPFNFELLGVVTTPLVPEIGVHLDNDVKGDIISSTLLPGIDFGSMRANEFTSITFSIRNDGEQYLNIRSIELEGAVPFSIALVSDGEGSAKFPTPLNPIVISSTQIATFVISCNPSTTGIFSSIVSIDSTDDNRGSEYPFTFNVFVAVGQPEIQLTDEASGLQLTNANSIVEYGVTTVQFPMTIAIRIENVGSGNMVLDPLRTVPLGFSQQDYADGTVEPNAEVVMHSELVADIAANWWGCYIFSHTDLPASPYFLGVHGQAVGPEISLFESTTGELFADATPIIDFQEAIIGFPVKKQIVVFNNGLGDLILGATTPSMPEGFRFDPTDPYPTSLAERTVSPLNSVSFTVEFTAETVGTYTDSTFDILSNDVNEGTFTVSMKGVVFGPDQPEISISEDSSGEMRILVSGSSVVDFGNTDSSTTVKRSFTIENRGRASLAIQSTSINQSGPVVVSGGSGVLSSIYDTQVLVVELTGISQGPGIITIENTDGK